ncbi:MAG: DNA polymerase III subunit delta' [Pseudomonadota bacterium]
MTMLVGHEDARATFIDAWRSGRMHHAWLLTGPRGVGKRTFAEAAARMVLAGTDGFEIPAGDRQTAAFDAGAHPDFRRLTRGPMKTSDRLARDIVVDQVRPLMEMLAQHPSLSEWRVVMVDAACEMNRSAANALLKSLEEPPPKTVFLLVCHSPGRLLPTVRSRCRTLAFRPLNDDDTRSVLARELEEEGDLDALVSVADGRPGRALAFAGLDIGALTARLAALETASDTGARDIALGLSQELALKAAQPRFEAFLELVPSYLAAAAKRAPPGTLEARLGLWEEAVRLAREAPAKSLDPATSAFRLARLVGRLTDGERDAA